MEIKHNSFSIIGSTADVYLTSHSLWLTYSHITLVNLSVCYTWKFLSSSPGVRSRLHAFSFISYHITLLIIVPFDFGQCARVVNISILSGILFIGYIRGANAYWGGGIHASVRVFNLRNYLNWFRLNSVFAVCNRKLSGECILLLIGLMQLLFYMKLELGFINVLKNGLT
jgi:hypothetical protein